MKRFIENTMFLSWLILGLLTLLIFVAEPPIGADPDLDRYHRESQMLFGAWMLTLGVAIVSTAIRFLNTLRKHF